MQRVFVQREWQRISMKESQEKVGKKVDVKKIEDPKNYVPIGKMIQEASSKPLETVELRELQREFNKDYMDELFKAAITGKKRHTEHDNYFVVVLMKRDRLMRKKLTNYFTTRVTCPTPAHDQSVYTFNKKTEDLQFLWVIPDKETCRSMYTQRYNIDQLHSSIMPYVVDFVEGRLNSYERQFNANLERNI